MIPSNKAVRPARLPRLLALAASTAVLLVLSAALPATAQSPPRPTGFAASNGNEQVTLTWDAPAEDADIWHHEYRFKTTGDYNEWTKIDDSGVGKIHEDWVVVTGLTNDVAYTFQLRVVNRDGDGNGVTAGPATPRSGVCGRTEQVRDAIVAGTADLRVSDCADVTRADLAGVMSLDFASVVIKSLQPGDFSDLTALTDLTLSGNELSSLPVGAFSGLTALTDLTLSGNELSSLPVGAFSGLTALTDLTLDLNELTSLPAGVFSDLTALKDLRLVSNKLSSLPAGVFSDLTALTDLSLFRNKLTSLPAGVFSDLTALTFLNLESNELRSLPAGVFSDLTALRALRLRYNKLSSLPAGVFSRLTALTDLRLGSNEFTSLPAGVFSDLTALTNLSLIGTKLSSLPAGVFSGLTALTSLYLHRNTEDPLPLTVTLERNPDAVEIRAVVLTAAPFAVPLVVSVVNGSLAGGAATITVPIGARESAWVGVTRTPGTTGAVTADIDLTTQPSLPEDHRGYDFVKSASDLPLRVLDVPGAPGAPAAPSVSAASSSSLTVIWSAPDDGGSAITDYDVQYREGTSGDWSDGGHNGTATTATLTGLSVSTSYQVQVRATNADGAGSWSDSGSGRTEDANAAPTFMSPPAFDAAENQTEAGTVAATDRDEDDSIEGYAITGGADRSFFSIGATSGALTFDAAPNYEDAQDQSTNNTYMVTVEATSGTGTREKTATQRITVTVTDVSGEAPGKPAAPTVTPASVSSLRVNWSAPANAGPAIDDYDVRYRAGTSGTWSDGGHTGTATTATLTGLSENTSYDVQVRATNDEGTGSWSDAGSGATDANAAPTFTSDEEFDAAENQTAAGTVRATDSDDDITGYAITGGADQAFFSIGATSGALTFDAAPNFEDAKDQGTDNTYVVTVEVTSGTGEREKTATQTITVTVTDVNTEAPGKPAAPTVAPASVSRLTVNWSVPSNAGPAITDYDVQYRAGTSGSWSDGGHDGTATTATLTGLSENTSYQVQVRATNDEGTGVWSDAGSGRTDANAAPSFSSDDAFDAAENQTAAGEVVATDSDSDDDITGYAITGGADMDFFSIGATSGALTFDAAPNYEDAKDQDTDNDLRGDGRGDQRHGGAGEDGDADDHGDGDGREHGGPGQAGRADGGAGVGVETDGELVGTVERGPGDHRLRRAVPGRHQRELERRGPRRHRHHGDAHGPVGGHVLSGAGAGQERRGRRRLVGRGQRRDRRQRGTGVQLRCGVRRGREPDGGRHGAGGGLRFGGRHHRLRDHRRRGHGFLLDRRDVGGADVRRGTELRGRAGPGHRQRLRGDGRGDQRHGRAGEDGDADDHGDGDQRGRRSAGQAGRADGDGRVGVEPDGELVGTDQRRSGHHRLRRAVPGRHQRELERRQPRRHRHHGDAHGPVGEHVVSGAGAGHQRRGHRRVVGRGQRHDGRQRGAGVQLR